jgi:hypothetical protein
MVRSQAVAGIVAFAAVFALTLGLKLLSGITLLQQNNVGLLHETLSPRRLPPP